MGDELNFEECMEWLNIIDKEFMKKQKTKFETLYYLLMNPNNKALHFYKKMIKIFIINKYNNYVNLYELYRGEKYTYGSISYFLNKLKEFELISIKSEKNQKNINQKKYKVALLEHEFHKKLITRVVNDKR